MFETWFTQKCTAFVDESGRALSGPALEEAKRNPNARRCGHLVKTRAKFCSKCGSPAPGGWWRCANCGSLIGNDSQSCPHCGRAQNVTARLDLSDGVWQKGDEVFAQRFDALEMEALMPHGLSVQEGQACILLSGGVVTEVLPAGHYPAERVVDRAGFQTSGEAKAFVMVDLAELPFPLMAEELFTKENLQVDLTCVAVIQFSPELPIDFLTNVMGARGYVANSEIKATLGYGDLAHFIVNDMDIVARSFCAEHTVEELFKDPRLHLELESAIRERLERNLGTIGMKFLRLKEVEFRGKVFDQLRKMAGDVEVKRREIEFQLQAAALANDSVRRKTMDEHEMAEFMSRLAQEKKIGDEMRRQEIERIAAQWKLERATAEQEAQDKFEINDAEHAEKLKGIAQAGELERRKKEHDELLRQRLAEQDASLTAERVEVEIQKLRLAAEQEAAEKWLELKQKKERGRAELELEVEQRRERGRHEIELERVKAYQGVDAKTLIAAMDDAGRGERLAKVVELEMQQKMSPELLLAAAAARGVPEAAVALSGMSEQQKALLERAKAENREIYEKMLAMNQEMFNKTAETMGNGLAGHSASPINVIK